MICRRPSRKAKARASVSGYPSKVFRLFYAIEFLIALIATYTVWSQVGGQGHLDMMAWYWKLALGVGISYATVKATAAAVSARRAWNSRTLRWISIILALGLVCGAV